MVGSQTWDFRKAPDNSGTSGGNVRLKDNPHHPHLEDLVGVRLEDVQPLAQVAPIVEGHLGVGMGRVVQIAPITEGHLGKGRKPGSKIRSAREGYQEASGHRPPSARSPTPSCVPYNVPPFPHRLVSRPSGEDVGVERVEGDAVHLGNVGLWGHHQGRRGHMGPCCEHNKVCGRYAYIPHLTYVHTTSTTTCCSHDGAGGWPPEIPEDQLLVVADGAKDVRVVAVPGNILQEEREEG